MKEERMTENYKNNYYRKKLKVFLRFKYVIKRTFFMIRCILCESPPLTTKVLGNVAVSHGAADRTARGPIPAGRSEQRPSPHYGSISFCVRGT